MSLALLDEKDTHGTAVQDRLRTMGHQLATFSHTADLLAALSNGQRFDLLLLGSQDEMARGSLRAVCEVLDMQMLVVPPGERWKSLASENEEPARRKRGAAQCTDWPAWEPRIGEMARGIYRFMESSSRVFVRGDEVHLPPRSFAFALTLFKNVDTVLTRDWLWNSVWKAPPERTVGRVIDVCAASVRRKLALNADNGFELNAVYGKGYQLVSVAPGHGHPASGPHTR